MRNLWKRETGSIKQSHGEKKKQEIIHFKVWQWILPHENTGMIIMFFSILITGLCRVKDCRHTWACRSKVTMEKHRLSRKYCSWRVSKAPPTRNAIMLGLWMSSEVQKTCTTPRHMMHTKRTCDTNTSQLITPDKHFHSLSASWRRFKHHCKSSENICQWCYTHTADVTKWHRKFNVFIIYLMTCIMSTRLKSTAYWRSASLR